MVTPIRTTRPVVDTQDDPYSFDRERFEQETARGASFFKPRVPSQIGVSSTNWVRILIIPSKRLFYVPAYQHWNVGPNKRNVMCAARMLEERCAVCEEIRQLNAEKSTAGEQEAKKLLAKETYFSAIIDVTDQASIDKGVQVYSYGKTVMRGLRSVLDTPGIGNPFSPTTGRPFLIAATKDGAESWNVKYAVSPGLTAASISTDQDEIDTIMAQVEELTGKQVVFQDYQAVRRLLRGGPDSDAPPIAAYDKDTEARLAASFGANPRPVGLTPVRSELEPEPELPFEQPDAYSLDRAALPESGPVVRPNPAVQSGAQPARNALNSKLDALRKRAT